MIATSLYAALFGLMLVWLSWQVIAVRRRDGVSLGEGNSDELTRRVRAQANFVEYVPLGLILIGLVEWHWKTAWLTHALGCMLLFGRAFHARGFLGARMYFKWRKRGMLLTFASLVLSSVALIVYWVRHLALA